MRPFLILVFLFSGVVSNGQGLSLHFSEILYDFGYIKESEGKVYHQFIFVNNEKEKIEIKEVRSSCGCMIPKASGKVLEAGEKGFIEVEYDPSGRPGKFIKSVEILAATKSKGEQTFFLNIKGVVIEKEILPAYNEGWKKTVLQIKPFNAPIISGSDFRFLNDGRLQDFVNDITYEIDLTGFTTVKLELFVRKGEYDKETAEDLFLPIKKFLITELKRRNYSPNQIGFADNHFVISEQIPENVLGIIKISSLDFNNDKIPESGFLQVNENPLEMFRKNEKLNASNDSLGSLRLGNKLYRQNNLQAIATGKAEFEQFMSPVIRQVLTDGYAQIGIRLESKITGNTTSAELKLLQKKVIAFEKQIVKYAEENGIAAEKIHFSVPTLIVTGATEKVESKLLLQQLPILSPEEWFDPQDLLNGKNDTLRYRTPIGEKGIQFRPPLQDLPTYQQFIPYGTYRLDSARNDYKMWKTVIRNELMKGKKIRFLIESSASNSPTYSKYDNNYVARRRAKELKKLLDIEFSDPELANGYYKIEEPITLIQGPFFDSRLFGISLYDQYQYLKIIPIYDTVVNALTDLFPYQVNFNYNYFEIPSHSEVFQVFVNRLIPEIDKNGFIKIIIESSSSKIPLKNYFSNETLSFFRAENARKKLYEEIRKRGYDPRRIIIVEQRSLVQGPDYYPGDDVNSVVFEKFQYIKIIPAGLVGK